MKKITNKKCGFPYASQVLMCTPKIKISSCVKSDQSLSRHSQHAWTQHETTSKRVVSSFQKYCIHVCMKSPSKVKRGKRHRCECNQNLRASVPMIAHIVGIRSCYTESCTTSKCLHQVARSPEPGLIEVNTPTKAGCV